MGQQQLFLKFDGNLSDVVIFCVLKQAASAYLSANSEREFPLGLSYICAGFCSVLSLSTVNDVTSSIYLYLSCVYTWKCHYSWLLMWCSSLGCLLCCFINFWWLSLNVTHSVKRAEIFLEVSTYPYDQSLRFWHWSISQSPVSRLLLWFL